MIDELFSASSFSQTSITPRAFAAATRSSRRLREKEAPPGTAKPRTVCASWNGGNAIGAVTSWSNIPKRVSGRSMP